jgi:hypothetical protein
MGERYGQNDYKLGSCPWLGVYYNLALMGFYYYVVGDGEP